MKICKNNNESIRKALLLIFHSSLSLSILYIFLMVLEALLPLALLYAIKYLVDVVTQLLRQPEAFADGTLYRCVALFCGLLLLNRVGSIFQSVVSELLGKKTVDHIQDKIQRQSARLDLAYYDSASYHDMFYLVRQESGTRPLQLLRLFAQMVSQGLTLLGILLMFGTFSLPMLLVLLLAGLPSFFARTRRAGLFYRWRKEKVVEHREANYLSRLLTDRTFAKEIRMYGLAEYLQRKITCIRERLYRQRRKLLQRTALWSLLAVLVEVSAFALMVVLLFRQAIAGALTIGGFVMYFQAFRRGSSSMQTVVASVSDFHENLLFLNNLFAFLQLEPAICSPKSPVPFPERIQKGIRFENVSFTYPNTDKKVLDRVYLEFLPHRVNRLGGANGSGKTTMVKLLCRLYECDEGAIYIDDTDIRCFDLTDLRAHIAVLFQDFVGYAFTAEENVLLSQSSREEEAWRQALRSSGADEVIAALPHAEQSLLGTLFEGGSELSMGQWQRVALARVLYRKAPVLLLDEPVAWMDAVGKAHFQEALSALGGETLLILVDHDAEWEKGKQLG